MASGADRISDLPEGVLHHILSLLPAHDAVRTCVLAQSWRHHWRSAPAVRFAGCTGWSGGVYTFGPFVDGLLRARRGGAPLDSCDFDLDIDLDLAQTQYDVPRMERHVNGWIRRALRRQVRELRFRVSVTPRRLPCTLEDRALASEHLTRLELAGVQGNAGVLDFSSCLALEDLRMEDSEVRSLEMHSPSLKHLRIRYCLFGSNYRTEMSFPSLVSFKFITNAGRVPILESMPSLETAKVRFDHFYDDRCSKGRLDDCGGVDCHGCYYYYGPDDYSCVFLEGLTEATDLKLTAYPDLYVFHRDLEWCPAFSKLKTLVLRECFVSADLSALIWFLHHAPVLEKLTLKCSKIHVLVCPKREVKRFADLSSDETSDLWVTAKEVGVRLEQYHKASSLTFAIQDGPQAGQTVPHVHIHVIPRKKGDFEKNDEIYDAIDVKEKELNEKLDLDIERRDRSMEEMAHEANEYRSLFS